MTTPFGHLSTTPKIAISATTSAMTLKFGTIVLWVITKFSHKKNFQNFKGVVDHTLFGPDTLFYL